ncbi:MAG: hypothetical protein AAF943_05155 [Pseudomonadota bacterium]
MKLVSLFAAVGIALASQAAAQTFRAENRVTVTPQSGGLFSVPTNTSFGARGAWCAAADYAIDVLGVSDGNRLYVRNPQSSNSGPVVFGISPGSTTPAAVSGISSALRLAGSNLSINHAYQYCHDTNLINSR